MTQSERIISFGEQSFIITTNDPQAKALLDLLFYDISQQQHQVVVGQSELVWRDGAYNYTESTGNKIKMTALGELSAVIMSDVIHRLIKDNHQYLAIHAALVSHGGNAFLMPATSGSGKSSLTMWCLQNGFQYHTDELVLINPDTFELSAFTRPIKLRRRGLTPIHQLIGDKLDQIMQAHPLLVSHHTVMLPHRLLNPNYQIDVPPLNYIIFPSFQANQTSSLVPISAAKASLELMQSNVIARNFDNYGFTQMCQLARQKTAFNCYFQHFADIAPLFKQHHLL